MNANHIPEVAEQDIQKEAYQLYLASGCVSGHDLENWLVAKANLAARKVQTKEKTRIVGALDLHFPLSSNLSRAPFGSNHPFINRS